MKPTHKGRGAAGHGQTSRRPSFQHNLRSFLAGFLLTRGFLTGKGFVAGGEAAWADFPEGRGLLVADGAEVAGIPGGTGNSVMIFRAGSVVVCMCVLVPIDAGSEMTAAGGVACEPGVGSGAKAGATTVIFSSGFGAVAKDAASMGTAMGGGAGVVAGAATTAGG